MLFEKKTREYPSSFYFCSMIQKIAVAGAGTMGSGIALSFALKGFDVILFDAFAPVLEKAKTSVQSNLEFLLNKGKISEEEKSKTESCLQYTAEIKDCKADLVIEAIIEKAEAKQQLFTKLSEWNNSDCIFASNTSSLSITQLQQQINTPQRVAGLHFFNPAQVMKLVEVIKGEHTSEETIQTLADICKRIDKIPVICTDAPGFIVNRVARHFYLESMKIMEHGMANAETIDAAMEATGFKMGPFKLMDMIGMDINLAVSQSLYDAFGKERFKPSPIQVDKVTKGELGRKTKKGFYQY